ncbi:hypothetical protein V6L77_15545 [Pannonibacter sp. Pt2-lr]|uniref:Uncharacterized protein n=1 Tax=Pannonibacter anstelovis TaxID=3121537 RepID=A0ABU7ZQU3_9HYPH
MEMLVNPMGRLRNQGEMRQHPGCFGTARGDEARKKSENEITLNLKYIKAPFWLS